MEQKIFWKNFLLLAVGGLLALHINVATAETHLNEKKYKLINHLISSHNDAAILVLFFTLLLLLVGIFTLFGWLVLVNLPGSIF